MKPIAFALAVLLAAATEARGPKPKPPILVDTYSATVIGDLVGFADIFGHCTPDQCVIGCIVSIATDGGTFDVYFYGSDLPACETAAKSVGLRVHAEALLSPFRCPGDFCELDFSLAGTSLTTVP